MSASESLSPTQFSVERIGKLMSAEAVAVPVETVRQLMLRNPEKAQQVAELARDVQERGVQEPLEVVHYGGKYPFSQLQNGHHRYAAAVELGLEHLPVNERIGKIPS